MSLVKVTKRRCYFDQTSRRKMHKTTRTQDLKGKRLEVVIYIFNICRCSWYLLNQALIIAWCAPPRLRFQVVGRQV